MTVHVKCQHEKCLYNNVYEQLNLLHYISKLHHIHFEYCKLIFGICKLIDAKIWLILTLSDRSLHICTENCIQVISVN